MTRDNGSNPKDIDQYAQRIKEKHNHNVEKNRFYKDSNEATRDGI